MPTDDDDDGPDEPPQNWFTGGDRSGLAVQAPDTGRSRRGANKIIGDIIKKAAEHSSRNGASITAPSAPQAGSSVFHGSGHTLGSDEVESQLVPDPSAPATTDSDDEFEAQRVVRELTFWQEGFSVDDGPLYRYDDPANAQLLEQINAGHAPPQALNVRVGQPVEVRVARRTDEHYTPPPPRPFGGSGNRLGAPAPAVVGTGTAPGGSILMPGSFPGVPVPTATSSSSRPTPIVAAAPSFEVNMDEPNTSIQVRLADGTRLVCRMNHSHTVGDIRNFINASRPENSARAYTIQTTFPIRVLEDETQTVKDAGLLNSVVVQRWAN